MKIGVLTSSRADYGIYLPLLTELKKNSAVELEIIAFGTHLSNDHGYTVQDIIKDDYKIIHKVCSLGKDDSEKGIGISYGNVTIDFSNFWSINNFDLVFCLGDRFEMSAAVQASIPFGIKLAHIHGGETTLGAIDNVFRHQITLASKLHFVSTKSHKLKVEKLIGQSDNIFNVGSLSLTNLDNFKPLSRLSFLKKYNIKKEPFALVTFHPETIDSKKNIAFSLVVKSTLAELSKEINIVLTMPNADTLGSQFRNQFFNLKKDIPEKIVLIENFGKKNYFSAMFYSSILIGNTSSGIIESASFAKYFVNVGDRQKGRSQSKNVFNAIFDKQDILNKVRLAMTIEPYNKDNIYYNKNCLKNMMKIITNYGK